MAGFIYDKATVGGFELPNNVSVEGHNRATVLMTRESAF